MSRPRKSPEQRLAEATTDRLRAEFDILASRAEVARMPAREVRAIRSAMDLFGVLHWEPSEVENVRDYLGESIGTLEADRADTRSNFEASRAAAKSLVCKICGCRWRSVWVPGPKQPTRPVPKCPECGGEPL